MVWKSEGKSGFDRIPLTNRLIVANRATHNKHEKELEALEKQILEMKIENNGSNVSDFDPDVISFLASRFSKNVRELEGALNRLLFYVINVSPTKHVTMDVAEKALQTLVSAKEEKGELTIERIISTVADYYSLTPSQLTVRIRVTRIAMARHIAMYLIRLLLDTPFIKIGEASASAFDTVGGSQSRGR